MSTGRSQIAGKRPIVHIAFGTSHLKGRKAAAVPRGAGRRGGRKNRRQFFAILAWYSFHLAAPALRVSSTVASPTMALASSGRK